MGDGNNSLFYKNFIKSEKAMQASVYHPCRELAGEFHFTVLTFPDWQEDPGIYFNNIEADIRNTIAEWEEKGFTDDELAMVKTEMETQMISQKTSISSKASAISSMEWLGRGKYNISDNIKKYNDVTREDVMRVFNKYIKNRKAVFLTVRPKSPFVKELDSIISVNPNANLILKEDPQYENLVYKRPEDGFERSVQPKAGIPKAPKVPEYYKTSFENGLKVIGTQTSETPKVYLRLTLRGGALLEEAKKVGLASFTADMMNESTQTKDSEAISVALRSLGSSISFSSSGTETFMYIETMTKNLDATLVLAKEKLLNPAFNSEEFKIVKKTNRRRFRVYEKERSILSLYKLHT
jgi:zinc protease